MKCSHEIIIKLPLAKVIKLFNAPEYMAEWYPGLIEYIPQNGQPRTEGATAKLVFSRGQNTVEVIETTVANKLPSYFVAIYEATNVWNRMESQFTEENKYETRWYLLSEYKNKAFLKVMMLLMPGLFKKQSLEYMKQFKDFSEKAIKPEISDL